MIDKYIGIPFVDRGQDFNGADCYGLVRLIYKEELNTTIPEFNSSCTDTRRIWIDYIKQISEHWELVTEYEPMDVLAFAYDPNHPRVVQHFGVYIGNGMMIHTLQGIGAFTCKITEFSYCLKGAYRWKQLDSKSHLT